MLRKIEIKILVGIIILFATLIATAFCILQKRFEFLILLLPLTLFQLIYIYRSQKKAYSELDDFLESVKYKDFSRHFNVKKAPVELKALRLGFNEINDTFRTVSKDKETQYQYLQKILEMVDTGILSYNVDSHEVLWINESLKQMLQLPYLKSLESLEKRHPELFRDIIHLKPGESKIASTYLGLQEMKLLLTSTAFQTGDKKYVLVGFQNISTAVEETESEAWKKLLSVMTHEIMNSVAPISSLAATLQQRLAYSKADTPDKPINLEDVTTGIDTIKRRSESLLKFAETYRSLNKIAAPDVKTFYVCDLFENIFNLMGPTLESKGIEMEILLKDPQLQLNADNTLIEQVLINLVVNAIEAVKDKNEKIITLSGDSVQNKTVLKVCDNGIGMTKEVLEKIFIPFFTTRKNGSGIGLSLCRQIMRAHHGNLLVASEEGKGTVFTLQF